MLRDGTHPSINPFLSDFTFAYPLTTSRNLWFSDVFRGHENATSGRNRLRL